MLGVLAAWRPAGSQQSSRPDPRCLTSPVHVQLAAERRGLKADGKRIEREIAITRADVGKLTNTLTMANGPAADALLAKLAESQERLTLLDSRRREVEQRAAAIAAQNVDSEAVGRALAQFTEVWEVLLAPERERVIRLLIDRIDYDGATGELKLTFSATGAILLANEASA